MGDRRSRGEPGEAPWTLVQGDDGPFYYNGDTGETRRNAATEAQLAKHAAFFRCRWKQLLAQLDYARESARASVSGGKDGKDAVFDTYHRQVVRDVVAELEYEAQHTLAYVAELLRRGEAKGVGMDVGIDGVLDASPREAAGRPLEAAWNRGKIRAELRANGDKLQFFGVEPRREDDRRGGGRDDRGGGRGDPKADKDKGSRRRSEDANRRSKDRRSRRPSRSRDRKTGVRSASLHAHDRRKDERPADGRRSDRRSRERSRERRSSGRGGAAKLTASRPKSRSRSRRAPIGAVLPVPKAKAVEADLRRRRSLSRGRSSSAARSRSRASRAPDGVYDEPPPELNRAASSDRSSSRPARLGVRMPHNEPAVNAEGELEQVTADAEVIERPALSSGEPIWQAQIAVPQGGVNHSGQHRLFTVRGPPRKTQEQAANDASELDRMAPQGTKAVRLLANQLHRN